MNKVKLVFKIILFLCLTQVCVGQKTYSISGQVISEISKKPLIYSTSIKINIKGDTSKTVFLDENGLFKILNITSGDYTLIMQTPDEAGNYSYIRKDTVLSINEKNKNLIWILDCSYCECRNFDKEGALNDIRNGKIKLVLCGGISPLFYKNQEEDEKKYGFTYYEFGCLPIEDECIEAYNDVIFDYLDKKFGNKWRFEVRKDVLGLRK